MLSETATQYLAYGVLAVLLVAPWVWALVAWRRTRYTLPQAPFMLLNQFVCRVLWRLKVEGRLELPEGQEALLVCNHRSPYDPWFIGVGLDQLAHWMVAREYCEQWFFGFFLGLFQVIPTRRSGNDTKAILTAIKYLQQGDIVGMLPEGRINETDELLLPGRPGAALVALKAKVPIIPCYVEDPPYDGTVMWNLLKPAKVRLVIGKLIDISQYYDRANDRNVQQQLTLRLLHEMACLAGEPDFQPSLAGRRWVPDEWWDSGMRKAGLQ